MFYVCLQYTSFKPPLSPPLTLELCPNLPLPPCLIYNSSIIIITLTILVLPSPTLQ